MSMAMLKAEEDEGEKGNNWYNWIELIRLHKMNQCIAMGNKPVAPMQLMRIGESRRGRFDFVQEAVPARPSHRRGGHWGTLSRH